MVGLQMRVALGVFAAIVAVGIVVALVMVLGGSSPAPAGDTAAGRLVARIRSARSRPRWASGAKACGWGR